jgi:glycosyltransferase involved in cell wall biosynthesis
MKVIHVCQKDDPATGGAVRVAVELVKRLINHQIDARLLFLYGKPGYFAQSLNNYCDYLGLKDSRDIFLYPRLTKYLAQKKSDIVHHHDDLLWPQLLTIYHPHYKKVIHAHGGGTPKPQPFKTKSLYLCQKHSANLVIAITKEAKASQYKNVGFNPEIIHIIYNGVDLNQYQCPDANEKNKARQNWQIPSDKVVAGFVGRLNNQMKGVDDFIKVIYELPQSYIGLVVGSGPDLEQLKQQVHRLNVSHRITFTGLLNEPRIAYQAMDVFCFTSRFEPFGLTIIEAMASGVPVVGFRCEGGSDEILTNQTGKVIENRDIQQMATAIQSIPNHPEQWQTRLKNAEKLIKEKFNWDISVKKLINLYHQLIQE